VETEKEQCNNKQKQMEQGVNTETAELDTTNPTTSINCPKQFN
jgi:hypothetical protein